jgi:hypothetical protein
MVPGSQAATKSALVGAVLTFGCLIGGAGRGRTSIYPVVGSIDESWSGRPGSNRRHSAWEADVLPLNYSRFLFHYRHSQHFVIQRQTVAIPFMRLAPNLRIGVIPAFAVVLSCLLPLPVVVAVVFIVARCYCSRPLSLPLRRLFLSQVVIAVVAACFLAVILSAAKPPAFRLCLLSSLNLTKESSFRPKPLAHYASGAVEKSASPPPLTNNRPAESDHMAHASKFFIPFSAQKSHVKPLNHLTPYQTPTSAWHVS